MSKINEWAKGKPLPLAMVAIELAFDAEYCFECSEQIKKREGFFDKVPMPTLDEWMDLYKNHHRIFDLFDDIFIDSRGLVESAKDFTGMLSEGLREIKKIGLESIKEEYSRLNEDEKGLFEETLEEIKEELDKIYKLQIKDIDSDINYEKDEELENRIKKNLHKPEIRFLYQVFTPCFLLYKSFPSRLLRKARKGDMKYIENLIRLDSSIIYDKKIAELIHIKRKNKMIKDKISLSIANGINEKVTRKKMKMNLAGLISFFSMKVGRQLKESEIRDLFDAIAKDKGKGDIDEDIPDSPESFGKAIQRERRNWENAFNNARSFT